MDTVMDTQATTAVERPSDGPEARADGSSGRGLPSLPPGYTSQVAWGFRDRPKGRTTTSTGCICPPRT